MEVAKITNRSEDDEVMLPGFRFHPTDEELVGFYLRRKVEKKPISMELIKQIDIYKYDPWDLPKASPVGEKEWYFFCIRGRKYRNSIRPNRVTGSGFWKATGIDKPIYSMREPHDCIGLKKSLVYYRGSAGKGTKTDWMMHEFRLPPHPVTKNADTLASKNIDFEAEVWTLCRIFKRIPAYRRYTPEFKNTNPRPNPGDSSSKTCSLESENSEQYLAFGDSPSIHQIEHKPLTNLNPYVEYGANYMVMNHMNPISQASHMASYPSFWNTNEEGVFDEGNWDELRSVVELANGNRPISDSQF